jgi:hypothetical protein
MRLLMINLLAAVVLLFSAATASADTLRLETTYVYSTTLEVSDFIAVDVFLDCDCAGGADPSDYQIVQWSVLFDETELVYEPQLSSPNTGANETNTAGILIFGPPQVSLGLVIIGGAAPDLYYGTPATGGPHPIDATQSNRILMAYTSKGFLGTKAGGEWYAGTLVFHVKDGGDGTATIQLALLSDDLFQDGNGNNITDQVSIAGGPIIIHTPEPTTALLIGLGLVGLGVAGRRRE